MINKSALFAVFFFLSLGLFAETTPGETPVVSKTTPILGAPGAQEPEGKFHKEGEETAALPTNENVLASSESAKAISQEIQSASHDEVPIVLEPPPTDLPFKDVVSFARPGQTERVLTGPVDHMPANEILGLAVLDSRQAMSPLQFKIPKPPFIQMEVPSGAAASNWSFQVLDQTVKTVYHTAGMTFPRDLLVWDGYQDGVLVLRAGVVYQPVFKMTDARGLPQQYFGDPIRLDALQFDQGGARHLELRDDILFQRDSSDFSSDAMPLVRSMLNIMRENLVPRFTVTLHEDDGGADLANRRLQKLSRFLEDSLVLESDNFSYSVVPSGERGPVVEVIIPPPARGGL